MSKEKKIINFWLMKSEPEVFSIDDLKKKKRWYWDGVRGYQARNYMRDDMCAGDMIIFYHSNANPIGPAGIARVVRTSYPDHTQFDPTSPYFDPKATQETPRWYMVDVGFVKKFPHIISRDVLKRNSSLNGLMLWSHSRLSITPLSETEFETILTLTKELKT